MGLDKMRLTLLLVFSIQCSLIWSPSPSVANALNIYGIYPFGYEPQQEPMIEAFPLWPSSEDEAQVVKRRPNNYKFLLKGLRGKRSIAPEIQSHH